MATREIYNALDPNSGTPAFNIQTINTDTTTSGNIIDTADYDGGILFLMFSGTLTDGTYTPVLQEGDASDLSDATSIADANITPVNVGGTWYATGQEAALAFAATDDNKVKAVSVVGTKRYVRLQITSASTSSGGIIGAIVLRKGEIQSVYGK